MDTTLSGFLGSGRGVRDGVTTPEPGGFLDTSNDERPDWSFRWPVADYREKKRLVVTQQPSNRTVVYTGLTPKMA